MSLRVNARFRAQAEPVLQAGPHQIRHAQVVEVLRQTDVPVVVADHAKAGIHQPLHQRGRPGNQLHAQAHDQQHDRPVVLRTVRARVLDLDLDAVCFNFHSC
jgi:hypothetical protein